MSRKGWVRFTLRMTEDVAESVYEWKTKLSTGRPQSLNDFICQCLCGYFDQRGREEIDKQFGDMDRLTNGPSAAPLGREGE